MAGQEVTESLQSLFRGLVNGQIKPTTVSPAEAEEWLDDLCSSVDTYRDGALIVLAFAVDAGETSDVGLPPASRRGVSKKLAALFDELHIAARRDVFQTIAKGSATLLGRDRASWNELLLWARDKATLDEVRQAMLYMASRIAATARDLPPMPVLDVGRLTFRRVVTVTDGLLGQPSAGAHEQFTFAALLHAIAEEYGNRRVETKTLNAADASAGTAGDVQVLEGGQVIEAYEITAAGWQTKIAQSLAVLQHYDLRRAHIVAPGPAPSADRIRDAVADTALPTGLTAEIVDLSVLDIRQECRSLVHRLSRPGRRNALSKLWEHLAARQPNDELVRQYVERLGEAGVIAES